MDAPAPILRKVIGNTFKLWAWLIQESHFGVGDDVRSL